MNNLWSLPQMWLNCKFLQRINSSIFTKAAATQGQHPFHLRVLCRGGTPLQKGQHPWSGRMMPLFPRLCSIVGRILETWGLLSISNSLTLWPWQGHPNFWISMCSSAMWRLGEMDLSSPRTYDCMWCLLFWWDTGSKTMIPNHRFRKL